MARTITSPTGSVALTGSLPVDVLMKSAPAIMHTRLAIPTLRSVASSCVARIVFICASPQAARNDDIDLLGPGLYGRLDLLHLLLKGILSGGKAGRNGGHGYI